MRLIRCRPPSSLYQDHPLKNGSAYSTLRGRFEPDGELLVGVSGQLLGGVDAQADHVWWLGAPLRGGIRRQMVLESLCVQVSSTTIAPIWEPRARAGFLPLAMMKERRNISHIEKTVYAWANDILTESIAFLLCLPMPTHRKFLGGVSHCFHGQHFKAVDV